MDYCDIEWFALETDNSVVFEIASKYCILDSFVDSNGRKWRGTRETLDEGEKRRMKKLA